MFWFNIKDGYAEGLCRGLRSGFLTAEDYRRMGMAESLEDLRSALEDSDYGSFLCDEPAPLAVTTITMKCRQRLSDDFRHLRSQANEPLGRFLDFVAAEKMIDNVIGLIQGTLNKKNAQELLIRVDPMGWFPEMRLIAAMDLTASYDELYRTLLIETPVGPYFEKYLEATQTAEGESSRSMAEVASIFSESDIEIMRNSLKKAWLEDFCGFCESLGGTTAEVMTNILKFEADFRVLTVTLNSINTTLGASAQLQDRNALYPAFGYLYPEGTDRIRKAWNDSTVRAALEPFPKYAALYEECKAFYMREGEAPTGSAMELKAIASDSSTKYKSLEDLLYAETVTLCELAFEQQFHYGIFYAWVKLKEQEIRNVQWIADMILMHRKEHIDSIIPIFAPRI
eukprot:GHVQ01036721.1.p1 GENE.GHVQ01036721.1~~GHVQ01036721.1.p1  ORF type:complete len:397 (+),score=48.91 GHVQ01036721.1:214-1404(+)